MVVKPESHIFQFMVAIFFLGWDGKGTDKNNFVYEKNDPGIRVPTFFRKIQDLSPHTKKGK